MSSPLPVLSNLWYTMLHIRVHAPTYHTNCLPIHLSDVTTCLTHSTSFPSSMNDSIAQLTAIHFIRAVRAVKVAITEIFLVDTLQVLARCFIRPALTRTWWIAGWTNHWNNCILYCNAHLIHNTTNIHVTHAHCNKTVTVNHMKNLTRFGTGIWQRWVHYIRSTCDIHLLTANGPVTSTIILYVNNYVNNAVYLIKSLWHTKILT